MSVKHAFDVLWWTGLVAIGIALNLWSYYDYPNFLTAGGAAWVQAIGSVAGIFTVAAVAWWQQKISKQAQMHSDWREKMARYFRARRSLQRFQERVQRERSFVKKHGDEENIQIRKRKVPRALRELEPELIFMRDIGGQTMTAMETYRRAHRLIDKGCLRHQDRPIFMRYLNDADDHLRSALSAISTYFDMVKAHEDQAAARE